MANFDDLEIEYDGEKKSHFPNSYRHVLFAKKRVQIGQIWPVWLHIYFTSGYRGFPPCTLSQHPVSRETGYSNVLNQDYTAKMERMIWCMESILQIAQICRKMRYVAFTLFFLGRFITKTIANHRT